jgi:hypothetical protein
MSNKINKNRFKSFLLIISLFHLVSCSTTGGLAIRNDISDGFGPLVPNCNNVSPNSTNLKYDTDFYHSSWSSAWLEGAQIGTKDGLEKSGEIKFKKEFAYALTQQIFGVDSRKPPFTPYCMVYDAPLNKVSVSIDKIIKSIGKPVLTGSNLVYGTNYLNRSHSAAKWRERYIVNLAVTEDDKTFVKVFRDLHISRQNEPYAVAKSDGTNEAWILKSVYTELKK